MRSISDQKNSYKKLEIAIVAFFFIWLGWNIFFGERIPENNGIGYDGMLYALMVEQFPAYVFHHQLPIYGIQRILPSGLIHYFAQLFHISIKHEQMAFV